MNEIHTYLIKNNLTISTIESCTSGLLANKLTSFSESSKFFRGSIIAYNDEIKVKLLKIDKNLIKKHTAVSKEVAIEMAISGKNIFNTDICISVTGYHEPGKLAYSYVSIFFKEHNIIKIILNGECRKQNRLQLVDNIIKNLTKILTN
jgi:PncC family amidohydrolase